MADDDTEGLDKANKTLTQVTELLTNVKALAVAALPIAAALYLLFSGQGEELWNHWVAESTGIEVAAEAAPFEAAQDPWYPPYVVVSGHLQDQGLAPEIEEFNIQRLAGDDARVRWQRDGETRVYRVTRDERGVWVYQQE